MTVKKPVAKPKKPIAIIVPKIENIYRIVGTDQDAQEPFNSFIDRHNIKVFTLYTEFKTVNIIDTKIVWDGQFFNIFTIVQLTER